MKETTAELFFVLALCAIVTATIWVMLLDTLSHAH